jgi:hypothetical protein
MIGQHFPRSPETPILRSSIGLLLKGFVEVGFDTDLLRRLIACTDQEDFR